MKEIGKKELNLLKENKYLRVVVIERKWQIT